MSFYLKFVSCKQHSLRSCLFIWADHVCLLVAYLVHLHIIWILLWLDVSLSCCYLFLIVVICFVLCLCFTALMDHSPVSSVSKAWKHFRRLYPVLETVVAFPDKEYVQYPLSIVTKREVLSYLFWHITLNHQHFPWLTSASKSLGSDPRQSCASHAELSAIGGEVEGKLG